MKTYAQSRERIAHNAVRDLRYSSVYNFEMDIKFLRLRGIRPEISCMDIPLLKKFRPSILKLEVQIGDNVKRIFDDLDRLEVFSELG